MFLSLYTIEIVFLSGHPVEEIRLRALENLQRKLDLKLISDVDILQYKYLYIKLLEWFNFPSPPKREVVLNILLKLSKVSHWNTEFIE